MPLPSHLLALPGKEASHLIALDLLAETVRTRPRLDDASDTEALHDFRVALRRLRSCLRTYRPELDRRVPGRLRQQLRRFARAAGRSRDLEVQGQWLQEGPDHGDPSTEPVASAMVETLKAQKARADRKLHDLLTRRFAETTAKMKRRLRDYHVRLDLEEAQRDVAGTLIAGRIRELADDLEQALDTIGSVHEIEAAHQARIAAKHVRYALEPIESLVGSVAPVIARLKSLQDVLGALHDSQVFEQRLDHSGSLDAVNEPAWLRGRLLQQRIDAMEQLRREWLTAQPEAPLPLLTEIRAVAEHIDPRPNAASPVNDDLQHVAL